jgi:uncharacterized SAM-dependent methyltransferase
MSNYKKTDLAAKYGLNPRTVTRWITLSREGKNDLELSQVNGKYHILKTLKNEKMMDELVSNRRKFLNTNSHKVIHPDSAFYEIYEDEQIQEILTQIDTDREVPHKYTYFDGGAEFWNQYAHEMQEHEEASSVTSTIRLLDLNIQYLDHLLKNYDSVNIIDVGVGNAVPSKEVIKHILDQGKLNRYVAIDISPTMLDIAAKNVNEWFGDKFKDNGITTETYTYDISVEPFAPITAEPPGGPINLILLLGGTLTNFNNPQYALEVIRKSMQKNDLLICTLKLDSDKTRDQFNAVKPKQGGETPRHREFVLNALGIARGFYDIITMYDEKERARSMRIKLKHAITIETKVMGKTWKVELNKADTLAVWHSKHYSQFEVEKLFYDAGFDPLHKSRLKDGDYVLLIVNKRLPSI